MTCPPARHCHAPSPSLRTAARFSGRILHRDKPKEAIRLFGFNRTRPYPIPCQIYPCTGSSRPTNRIASLPRHRYRHKTDPATNKDKDSTRSSFPAIHPPQTNLRTPREVMPRQRRKDHLEQPFYRLNRYPHDSQSKTTYRLSQLPISAMRQTESPPPTVTHNRSFPVPLSLRYRHIP